jgi:hypothetical protein
VLAQVQESVPVPVQVPVQELFLPSFLVQAPVSLLLALQVPQEWVPVQQLGLAELSQPSWLLSGIQPAQAPR